MCILCVFYMCAAVGVIINDDDDDDDDDNKCTMWILKFSPYKVNSTLVVFTQSIRTNIRVYRKHA